MENKISNKKFLNVLDLKNAHLNLPIEIIAEHIVQNGEGVIGQNGALMVDTGIFTGRSPKDKYFVDEETSSDNLWWGPVNKKIDESVFDMLYEKVINYYHDNDYSYTYIFEGFAGADNDYTLPVRIIAKKAWQYHFCRNMFINNI